MMRSNLSRYLADLSRVERTDGIHQQALAERIVELEHAMWRRLLEDRGALPAIAAAHADAFGGASRELVELEADAAAGDMTAYLGRARLTARRLRARDRRGRALDGTLRILRREVLGPATGPAQERRLGRVESVMAMRRHARRARAQLVESCLRTVVELAHATAPRAGSEELCELIGAGNLALVDAVSGYQPHVHGWFVGYARTRIEAAMRATASEPRPGESAAS